eukprot:CAMPEP_0117056762 /NCGR_PEP_ID=MMETSP0472-20121206/39389_1 /TAXON_ID=693140 ORGANISM="Tiarina fusus, Strain LIS" /NCGR_SAMPLE_ID=MMETSP0472 /ASSEMBLY_ACC=CAM_ASM_000603 /LENGTH=295 /DNA_ID=CAMNT_0004773349 /DNA_START=104 /DNA_END=991 /DNA_ORIENTATION=-
MANSFWKKIVSGVRCAGSIATFGLVAGGLVLSVLSSLSCEFFAFESTTGVPWSGLKPPFENVVAARVGIFSYRRIETSPPSPPQQECQWYDEFFAGATVAGKKWVGAQFCAVFAVAFGLLGLVFQLCDSTCSESRYSHFVPYVFLMMAFGLQLCTFLIFLEEEDINMCFARNSPNVCELEDGGWFSVASVCAFWLASTLLCCLPRGFPFFGEMCFPKKEVEEKPDSAAASEPVDEPESSNGRDLEQNLGEALPLAKISETSERFDDEGEPLKIEEGGEAQPSPGHSSDDNMPEKT